MRVQVLARDVMISLQPPQGLSALNVLAGTIAAIGAPSGVAESSIVEVRIDCHGQPVLAHLTRYSVDKLELAAGRPVYAVIKSVAFASRS